MHRVVLLLVIAACTAPAPPSGPPAYTDPPAVREEGFVRAHASASVPMAPTALRAFLTEHPLTDYFEPTGSLSPPAEIGVLRGAWPTPGAARWVRLEDGHYIVERILENEAERFRYQIWVFTNAAGRGVDQIVAEQRFIPTTSGGTRFEWDYDVYPSSVLTRPFVKRFRDRELQAYLQGATDRMSAAASEAVAGG